MTAAPLEVRQAGTHWRKPLGPVDLSPLPGDKCQRLESDQFFAALTSLRAWMLADGEPLNDGSAQQTSSHVLAGRYDRASAADRDAVAVALRDCVARLIPEAYPTGDYWLVGAAQVLAAETAVPDARAAALMRLAGATRDLLSAVASLPPEDAQ
ncbi:hypothetical protein [Streptomyces yaizuensis]|uniref:hypothetical protein n=1 Tax=Streptomyces yaizuensis TaxID=2989713 RepID=UPI002B2127B7|nr:hypothetical protein [Streptomyces sp. YSPA8]